jgi:dTDP-glucose pyrophosphorylase
VVVKHLKRKIKEYLGDGKPLGVTITYVEQKEALGIAHAVGQLEGYIDIPFLLTLGDIFFIPQRLNLLLETFKQKEAACVLGVKKESDQDLMRKNFAVILGKGKTVKTVIEKPRYSHVHLKGCGIYLFSPDIFDAIRMTPRTAMRDEYEITNSIQILIDDGYRVYAEEVVKWDTNITCPVDLLRCNLYQLENMRRDNLIGENCRINKDARIVNSVIGSNVVVKRAITIQDSVVYPDLVIKGASDIKSSLVTAHSLIRCDKKNV